MERGLETIAFLANSENRVRVLTALAEQPRERAALRADTATTPATLARILADLEDRRLVHHEAGTYTITPAGRELIVAFQPVIQTAAALENLGELVAWFPFGEVGFDARHLHDARIVRPSKVDPIRPVNRSFDLIEAADHVRLVASQHAPPALDAFCERVEAGRLQFEAVLTRDVVATVRASDRDTANLRRLLDSPRAALAVSDADIGYNAAANDDTIVITVSDDSGAPRALIETDSRAIVDWFDDFFDRHREAAAPLTAADIDE